MFRKWWINYTKWVLTFNIYIMICKVCKIEKQLDEFYDHKQDGNVYKYRRCIECCRKSHNDRYYNKLAKRRIVKSSRIEDDWQHSIINLPNDKKVIIKYDVEDKDIPLLKFWGYDFIFKTLK